MSISTKIQWCDSTCNPTMGCEGCELWNAKVRKCYAGILHLRFGGTTKGYSPTFDEVTYWPGRMAAAAHWSDLAGSTRKSKRWLDGMPRLIFVSDMSDSLSAAVDFDFLEQEIICAAVSPKGRRHRWLWLTKRPDRMCKFSNWLAERKTSWPANLWAGTSITTPRTTGRVDDLLNVGDESTIRFVSIEPQYERVDLSHWLPKLHWVIQGGESGHNAQPFDIDWAFDLKRQCQKHRVPYFLKQLGSVVVRNGKPIYFEDHHAGDWCEWPEELRLRQIPTQGSPLSCSHEEPSSEGKSKAERSEIAKRAWATRKADAAKRNRSEAARKACQTRRSNEAKKKRSAAAKKAWKKRKDSPTTDKGT